MTRFTLAFVVLTLVPQAGLAACYVEYKAKQDQPLQLHYGILSLSGSCPDRSAAARAAASRLAAGGWDLLNVVGLSSATPSATQRANAGAYYLRY